MMSSSPTLSIFLITFWAFLLLIRFSSSKAQSCGGDCTESFCIEQICHQCLENNHTCPPWLQGRWSGLHLRQDGTTQNNEIWEMEVIGHDVTMSGQGVNGLQARAYCKNIERTSSGGGASAYDMDLIYDSPAGYKGSASRSITQLYYDGLDVDTMQLQVMLPFRFVPYETDECNTPRIPTSEFAAPIPLTYWVVRFECTTPQLTYECPHWYDGKWAAATWAPQGGIGGNFVKTRQLLNVAGSEALMTSSNLNTDSDAASIQYAMKCTDFSSSNENLQINLGVDFATTDSTPSHISRGVSLFSSFPGRFDLTLAQPNWCQRPYNTNNAFIHPVAFEPPHVISTFICIEPIMQDPCTTFLLGTWRGESALLAKAEMNNYTWNTTRRHSGNSIESEFWVESQFNGRDWLEASNISCSASTTFPSLVTLDIHHSSVNVIDDTSDTSDTSYATKVAGWITHALVRFGSTYSDVEIVLGEPGKCNRPTVEDLSTPSGGFKSFRMTCAIKKLRDECPPWLIGPRNTTDNSFLSGMIVRDGSEGATSPFDMFMSIPNNYIFGTMTCGNLFNKGSVVSSSVAIDINITSPTSLTGWIQRGWATYSADVGAVVLHIASPGICLRPEPNTGVLNSRNYNLHLNNHDHIRTSIYSCSTPPLVGACPRWLDGTWNIVASGIEEILPEWMNTATEPLNLTIVGSIAYIGLANGAVVKHWITCDLALGSTVSVDFQSDSQSILVGRKLRVLASFDDNQGTLKMALANYGWCSRPVSLYDISPYHVNTYSCTTPLVGSECPRWLDGHWDILQEITSSLVFAWEVKSNISTIALSGGSGSSGSGGSGVPAVRETDQIVVYCGEVISSALHEDMEIDLSYRSNTTGLPVIERGWLRRVSVLPRSSANLIRSPPNWCYRHAPGSASVRFDNVKCSTVRLNERCPGWMRGTWKFHDSHLLDLGGSLPFQSRKWVVSNNVRYVNIDDNGKRSAILNCSNTSISAGGINYRYMDVSYISDSTDDPAWHGRMDHFLVALDSSNPDTIKMSLVEAPPGWCSRPSVSNSDKLFRVSTAIQVEIPRPLTVFVVLPIWETLKVDVLTARSTLKFVWDNTIDDRNSPVNQFLLMWDVEPQISICDVAYGGGTFGSCCNGDNDCSSGVCDIFNRVCTYICRVDSECPSAQNGLKPVCKDASYAIAATYDDPLPVRKWCDASQLTPFGNTFCGNFCLTSDGAYANDIATALASSTTCEDTARETCLSQRFQERACHRAQVRNDLGLSGYQMFIDSTKNATIDQFVVGLRYYSKIFASNEIGLGWPTKSIPSFEIPRAAPPPPSFLAVTQVEAATLNASGMTLEDAKTSIKVLFTQPVFDNGAFISTHFVEWHVHPSFVDIASHVQDETTCKKKMNEEQSIPNSILYGMNECGPYCLNNKQSSICTDYPSCPFSYQNESEMLCHELNALSNDTDIIAVVTKDTERCKELLAEANILWESTDCDEFRSQVETASILPSIAFDSLLPLCELGTCSGNLWWKIEQLLGDNCRTNITNQPRVSKYLNVQCSTSTNGTSCGEIIPIFKNGIDNADMTCKYLRVYDSCIKPVSEFWKAVEATSTITTSEHYGRTIGKLHSQSSIRRRITQTKYANALSTLDATCPRMSSDVCPSSVTNNHACEKVREHCLCKHSLDPGCSHPHVIRRLQTDQTIQRMSVATIPNQKDYSIVVSNILPRTPYFVRVGALNELGLSMYRTTPQAVAALVIAEKPLDVVILLLSNITNTSTRAALSTSIFLGFRTAAIDWNWVTRYRIDVSTIPSFNDSTVTRNILVDQPSLKPFESGIVNMTVKELTPGVRYYFQVSAYITTYGRPQIATPVSIVPPLQVPDPPRNFTVYPVNGSVLGVNWSIPLFDGGRPLLSHQLEWSRHQNFSCSSIERPNNCGSKIIVLPSINSDSNENNTASSSSSSSSSSSLLSSSSFSSSSSSSSTANTRLIDASLTTLIDSVKMGLMYHVRISSCNDLGCGVLANHIPVKPMQPPSVPLQVSADVYNHSALSLVFAAPASSGGDSVDYYVVHWEVPKEGLVSSKVILPTQDLFQNTTTPKPPPWTGCNCTASLPYPSKLGKCCCSNYDCANNMICHPELRSCTHECTQCSSMALNKNVELPMICTTTKNNIIYNNYNSSGYNTSSSNNGNSSYSNNSNNSSNSNTSISINEIIEPTYCEARCPFNQTAKESPCLFRPHRMALDQSSCTLNDFLGGWVLSSRRGGIKNNPSNLCATYIRRYCSLISKNDPACEMLAIQHVLHDIPTCPQRIPPKVIEGMFATVIVNALSKKSIVNVSAGANETKNAAHQLGVSACNAAGCSDVALYDQYVTPSARLLFSEVKQCAVEGETSDKYFVSLNSKPTSVVEVRVSGDVGQLASNEIRIHFTPEDWNQQKEIVVIAADDHYDEGEKTRIVLYHRIITNDTEISSTIEYMPSNFVNVTIFDNDYAGIAISETTLMLEEGLTGKEVLYQAITRPYSETLLTLTATTSTFVSKSFILLSPNATDWDKKHSILFTATDDNVDEIDLEIEYVVWEISSFDLEYLHLNIPILSTMVIDDDFASLLLEYSSLQLNEGQAAATYRVSITSQPTSEIAILISVGTAPSCKFDGTILETSCNYLQEISTDVWVTSSGKVAVDEAVIYFKPSAWNVSQFFMVSAREDDMDMGDIFNMTLKHTSISEDNNYNRGTDVMVPLYINVQDNDEAVLAMSRWDVVVTEDGLYKDEYTILFETQPTAPACITASLEGFDQVSVYPSMLCFNEKNWSLPQAFHVSAVRPEPGTRDSVGALVGWVKHELVTDAIEYIGKTLSDVEITIVERFSDLDLTDAPTYESAAFSDIAHEIIIKFSSPAYVLEIGQEYATTCFSYFISRTLKLLGDEPTCYWSDVFTLHAVLGNRWSITPTKKVILRSGSVRTTASSIITSGGYKLLAARRPAPVLRSMKFSESGGAILISFDSNIGCWEGLQDDASTTSCSDIFENADSLLGNDAECTWVKSCLLQATLGFGANIRATKQVSACGTCECNSCVPTAAYEQAGSSANLCRTPSHQCADPQCFCKDNSPANLCPYGVSLSIVPNAIKAIRFGLLSADGCMHIQHPNNIFIPRSIITAPRNFPVCSSLVVSGAESETSGGGRDQFIWSVMAFDNDGGGIKDIPSVVSLVIAAANAVNSDILKFAPDVFEFGIRYRFSLRITNFLTLDAPIINSNTSLASASTSSSASSSTSSLLPSIGTVDSQQIDYHDVLASYIPLPQLTIIGSSKRVVKAKDRVILRAKATSALCAADQTLVYSWYQVQGDLDWKMVKSSQRGNYDLKLPVLSIPPNMLTQGRDYIFRVSAHARSTPTLTNYENVVLSVASGITVAGLDSYHRTCGADDPLSINAIDHSYHEDAVDAKLTFDWNCIYIKGGDGRVCNAMRYSNGQSSGMITLPRNTFAVGDEIVFTVNVQLVADKTDTASTNMTVTIVPGLTPEVRILQGSFLIINPEDKLSLSGTVQWPLDLDGNSGGELLWTELSGSLDLLAENQKVYYSALNRPNFVVRPQLLVPGRLYTFVLTATSDKSIGSASVLVEVNRPPRGGFFEVSPLFGNSLETEFSFSMRSWADDESNYPLVYSYYTSVGEDDGDDNDNGDGENDNRRTTLFPLSVDNVEISQQLFRLPPGKPTSEFKVYPVARVCDSLGACTICSTRQDGTNVIMKIEPISPSATLAAVTNTIDTDHASVGDTVVLGIAADMLYPSKCTNPRNSEPSLLCEKFITERRADAANMLNLLVASEAITMPSKIALEQQAMTLSEISTFADKSPSLFVEKLIQHGNRIVDSAFDSGFSLSFDSVVSLHAVFESLVDAASHNMSQTNKSWSIGQDVSAGIERAVSNALLSHTMGEDPMIVSGTKLSIFGKVESLSHMPWVPLKFQNLNTGPIGFSMPATIESIDSDSEALQFIAVAQTGRVSDNALINMVTDLSMYDSQAKPIRIGNLTDPIGVSLPSLDQIPSTMKCLYWNDLTETWSQNGLYTEKYVESNDTKISTFGCATTHLTSFLLETNLMEEKNIKLTRNYSSDGEPKTLIFIFDTSNIPVAAILIGMSTFYVLLIFAIRTHEEQTINDEYARASMERFLNTGSTAWTASDDNDATKSSASTLLKSFLATLAHQHPILGWTRPSSRLGMPRLLYVLVLWNTTSVMFFVSCASIGGAELHETVDLPLGWIYALCGLIAGMSLRSIVSCLLVWKSKQLGSTICSCCCCTPTSYAVMQSRKHIHISRSPTKLFVDFQRLRKRCITYAIYQKQLTVSTTVSAAQNVQNGRRNTNLFRNDTDVISTDIGLTIKQSSYERYVVLTAQKQGYPYPRSVFETLVVLQAVWRGYVVKTNLSAFHEKKLLLKKRSYIIIEEENNIDATTNSDAKKNSDMKKNVIKKNRNESKIKSEDKKKDSNAMKQSLKHVSKQIRKKQKMIKKNLRKVALVLQSCVSVSSSLLVLIGVSELFDPLHRQYAQAVVALGLFLVAMTSIGSFTLKYCNGYNLGLYVFANFVSYLATIGLLLMVNNAGDTDTTTLQVVQSEWEDLYSSSFSSSSSSSSGSDSGSGSSGGGSGSSSSTSSMQVLQQWQLKYQCCGIQDLNVMAIQPCYLNISSGCEIPLANRVKETLNVVSLALMFSTVIQTFALLSCCILSTRLDCQGFDSNQVIQAMEDDSAKMKQAFSRGKSPADLATSKLFSFLSSGITHKAANIIQNLSRVYLARRRYSRKQEYDRIVGLDTKQMQLWLFGSIASALGLSAVVLDVLGIALALKLDNIREARWRSTMELSVGILFVFLLPLVSVVTLISDPRWKIWLNVRCATWHSGE